MNKKGFSLVEILVAAATFIILSSITLSVLVDQMKANRGILGRAEINHINNAIREYMKDEHSCTATVQDAYRTAPNAGSLPLTLNNVVLRNFNAGAWTDSTFYTVGNTYSGLITIDSITLRDFTPGDDTPGRKVQISYSVTGSILGVSRITRVFDIFIDFNPSASAPGYNFRCSSIPFSAATSPIPPLNQITRPVIGCNPIRTRNRINCPVGQAPYSCGIQDNRNNPNEDSASCWLDIPNNRCVFNIDRSGSCDNLVTHCYCM